MDSAKVAIPWKSSARINFTHTLFLNYYKVLVTVLVCTMLCVKRNYDKLIR